MSREPQPYGSCYEAVTVNPDPVQQVCPTCGYLCGVDYPPMPPGERSAPQVPLRCYTCGARMQLRHVGWKSSEWRGSGFGRHLAISICGPYVYVGRGVKAHSSQAGSGRVWYGTDNIVEDPAPLGGPAQGAWLAEHRKRTSNLGLVLLIGLILLLIISL